LVATKDNIPLLGPLYYRLFRCSNSDVDQLNVFYNWRKQSDSFIMPTSSFSYGLGVSIGASEMYSRNTTTDFNYEQQLSYGTRLLSAGAESMAYAKYKTNQSLYTYNPNNKKYAKPQMPVYILVGTLDPQTMSGLGLWFKNGLGKL
jgi:hypothetical protein